VILGFSVLASLLAVEAVFRVRAWQLNYQSLDGAFTRQPERSPSGRTRFFDLIQPNPNDRIVYELRPGLKLEYSGCPLTTNSLGFRMPEFPREKQPGMITIVGLGGSIMFGHGVADGEDFFSVMGRLLAASHPERTWRCINTAVPSYNVVMKVESLKEKGLAFDPDLVVLGIASNNLDLPNYIRVEEDPYDLGRSFILDYIDEMRGIERESAARYAKLAPVDKQRLTWGSVDAVVVTDPAKIPARYRDLVGWDPFHRALDELKQLSLAHDFEVVVVANLDYDLVGAMLEAATERGFHVVLAQDDLEDWVEATYHEPFSLERYCKSELVVNAENLHPSALQHQIIGRRLAFELWQQGLIERLLAKVPRAP
jgi:hypothetical protein